MEPQPQELASRLPLWATQKPPLVSTSGAASSSKGGSDAGCPLWLALEMYSRGSPPGLSCRASSLEPLCCPAHSLVGSPRRSRLGRTGSSTCASWGTVGPPSATCPCRQAAAPSFAHQQQPPGVADPPAAAIQLGLSQAPAVLGCTAFWHCWLSPILRFSSPLRFSPLGFPR